jgi:hypothetical protein
MGSNPLEQRTSKPLGSPETRVEKEEGQKKLLKAILIFKTGFARKLLRCE